MNWRMLAVCLVLGCGGGVAVATAQEKTPAAETNWSRWRGPHANGISDETGLSFDWPADGPKVLWRAEVGPGYSAISTFEGMGYTMGYEKGKETVYGIELGSGKVVWKGEVPIEGKAGWMSACHCTPVTDGNQVYAIGNRGMAVAFDAKAGKLLWQFNLPKETGVPVGHYGDSASPVIYPAKDRTLVFLARAVALEAKTGKLAWHQKDATGPTSYTWPTPTVWKDNSGKDRVLYTAIKDFKQVTLSALDPLTGDVVWKHEDVGGVLTRATMALRDTQILPSGELLVSGFARFAVRDNVVAVARAIEYSNSLMGNPVVYKGHEYGFSYFNGDPPGEKEYAEAGLQCSDLESGKRNWWEKKLNGTLILADGKLIIHTFQGELVIAEPSPESYKELKRAKILNPSLKARDLAWTMPVLSNGRLYLRDMEDRGSKSVIACIELRKSSGH